MCVIRRLQLFLTPVADVEPVSYVGNVIERITLYHIKIFLERRQKHVPVVFFYLVFKKNVHIYLIYFRLKF